MTFISLLESRLELALKSLALELPENFKLQVSSSQDLNFGDYQSNVAMMLAKRLKKNPREFAQEVIDELQVNDIAECTIAGPGFINFQIRLEAWGDKLNALIQDKRMGVEQVKGLRTIVVDFSSPNIAKPMHVGHIRSSIIGDSISRVARFLGHKVITDNHIGDWGTQFGKVIYGWKNYLDEESLRKDPLLELLRLYKTVHNATKDDVELEQTCRDELVKLQQGDKENLEIWTVCVEHSKKGLQTIYDRLEISFDFWYGESFYNDKLEQIVSRFERQGLARESDGAMCVFSNGEGKPKTDPFLIHKDGDWQDLPMIIRKSDGAYNYATTDLATLDFRLSEWNADEILYVVDARQSAHFNQLFDIARRSEVTADLHHVSFGTINGKDGKPLKTREGDLPQLADILEDSVKAAANILEEKSGHLPTEEKQRLAEIIGVGSVKFTELSHHRASDYIFDLDKMVALQGDTAPYLQNAYVRVRSIFKKLEHEFDVNTVEVTLSAKEEVHLARMLSKYGEILPTVLDGYKPNILATYLLELARSFHSFFEACPVLKSEGNERESRLALCEVTASVLKHGLGLLGINVPERM